jgi:hypothetical protein
MAPFSKTFNMDQEISGYKVKIELNTPIHDHHFFEFKLLNLQSKPAPGYYRIDPDTHYLTKVNGPFLVETKRNISVKVVNLSVTLCADDYSMYLIIQYVYFEIREADQCIYSEYLVGIYDDYGNIESFYQIENSIPGLSNICINVPQKIGNRRRLFPISYHMNCITTGLYFVNPNFWHLEKIDRLPLYNRPNETLCCHNVQVKNVSFKVYDHYKQFDVQCIYIKRSTGETIISSEYYVQLYEPSESN